MKKICVLVSGLVLYFVMVGFAPIGATYLDMDTTELGSIRVYFNYNVGRDHFGDNDGVPVNITTGTITGYVLDNSGVRTYTITAQPFGEGWTYRNINGSYQSYTLHVKSYDLKESTLDVAGQSFSIQDQIYYILIFFAAAILLGVWRCSRK